MIPIKLFIKWTMILTATIGGPIMISIFIHPSNVYLLIATTIIPVITVPVVLTYIGWQMKKHLSERLKKYEVTRF